MKDLLVFLFIAVFVILGVGIYYEANFCPDQVIYWDEEDFLVMTWNIFIFPYWQLTGEHLNDYMYGNIRLMQFKITIGSDLKKKKKDTNFIDMHQIKMLSFIITYLVINHGFCICDIAKFVINVTVLWILQG